FIRGHRCHLPHHRLCRVAEGDRSPGPLRRGGGAAGPGDLPDLWDGRPAAHG
ncbi:hypothetical protein MCGFDL_MCGFDL_10005, partial [Dysosmobacter welbionis]